MAFEIFFFSLYIETNFLVWLGTMPNANSSLFVNPYLLLNDTITADEVIRQFEVVRHISAWNKAETLQEHAQAWPRSMKDLRKLYCILMTVLVTSAEAETFSKLAWITSKLCTTCGQDGSRNLLCVTLTPLSVTFCKKAALEVTVDRF